MPIRTAMVMAFVHVVQLPHTENVYEYSNIYALIIYSRIYNNGVRYE